MATALEMYAELRERIDARVGEVERAHEGQLECRPGCVGCCVNLTVFPVEYFSMVERLGEAGIRGLNRHVESACAFLEEGLCQIYWARPVICRTHGLPVAFLNDDAETPEMSVSFCPRNFARATPESLDFNAENTLDLDALNGELYEINGQFVLERPELGLAATDRIPLTRLFEREPAEKPGWRSSGLGESDQRDGVGKSIVRGETIAGIADH